MRRWLTIAVILLLPFFTGNAFWIGQTFSTGGGPSSCTTIGNLTCDSKGWTVLTPVAGFCTGSACTPTGGVNGTRIIYVADGSHGGNDSNAGTLASPLLTPKTAATFLRDGSPDWLLFQCGNVWLTGIDTVNKSGLNPSNPMVFSSYDPGATQSPPLPDPYSCSARPQFNLAPGWGGSVAWGTNTGSNLAYVGLGAYAYTRDPASGSYSSADSQSALSSFSVDDQFDSMLVEDCWVAFFSDSFDINNTSIYTPYSNLYLRRNFLVRNYATGPFDPSSVGLLTSAVNGNFSVFENVFDHNGWNTCVSGQPGCGSNTITWAPQSGFKHNLYFAGSGQNGNLVNGSVPVTTGNILANEGSAPALRTGAFSTDNLFFTGSRTWTENATTPSVTNTFTNNVLLQNIISTADNTIGMQLVTRYINENLTASPTNMFNNIFSVGVNNPDNEQGFSLGSASSGNTVLGNIFYNWSAGNSANVVVNGSACNLTATSGCPIYSSTGYANITSPGSSYVDKSVAIGGSQSSNMAYSAGFFNWPGDGQNYDVVVVPGDTAAGIALYGTTYSTSGNLVGANQSTVLDRGVIGTLGTVTATTCSVSPSGCADGTYNGVLLTGGNSQAVPAVANIVVSGRKVISVALAVGPAGGFCSGTGSVCGGFRYLSGDVLSIDPASIGGVAGGATNFTVPIATFQPGHVIIYGTTCDVTCLGGFTGTLYYPWYNVPLSCTGVGSSGCAGTTGATGAQADLISAGGQIVTAYLIGSDNDWCREVDNSGGTGYSVGDTLNAPPSTALTSGSNFTGVVACASPTGGFSWNGSANTGSGMVITIPSGGIAVNTIAATGCNLATQNDTDPTGVNTNSCTRFDPNRSAGSYYSTLAGSTANATFTGSITSGVLSITSITGSVNIGDGITWAGQTKQDFVKSVAGSAGFAATTTTGGGSGATFALGWTGNTVTSCTPINFGSGYAVNDTSTITGGTFTTAAIVKITQVNASTQAIACSPTTAGSYSVLPALWLASKDNASPTTGVSGTLSDWTIQQLIAAQDNVFKATWGSNNLLSACNVNNYIRQGFSVAAITCPAGG